MSEGDILALAEETEGATIYEGLDVLYQMGLCDGFAPASSGLPGLVLGVQAPEGPHTVVTGFSGLITWGKEVRCSYDAEEAWLINWPVTKERA
jgi:hypothetical protein